MTIDDKIKIAKLKLDGAAFRRTHVGYVPDTRPVEKTTNLGHCRDCDSGSSFSSPGFALYIDDDGREHWWYCLYCGSNHVDIKDAQGRILHHQGDLYEAERAAKNLAKKSAKMAGFE